MDISFTYVDSDLALQQAANEWNEVHTIGIDLECENNLHHYGMYMSLFQISTGRKHYLVDALTIKNFKPLIEVLENPFIQKIFHDVSFDVSVIYHQLGCKPRNLFDTEVAALLLGFESVGLKALLEKYFHEKKESKFQMADWTKRPLTKEMMQYAIKDAVYLIKLRNILVDELRLQGRLQWAKEEFLHLEIKEPNHKIMEWSDMRGVRQISDQDRAFLKRLFNLRERLAKKVDRPVHFVLSNKRMMELVENPPKNVKQWKSLKGVHPILRQRANLFAEAFLKSRSEGVVLERKPQQRLKAHERQICDKLESLRLSLSKKYNIQRYLIMTKDQMQSIATTGKYGGLRPWQRKLILDAKKLI